MGCQAALPPPAKVTRALNKYCERQRAPGTQVALSSPPCLPQPGAPALGTHICSALLVALIRPRSWVSARIMRAHFSWP